MGGAASHEAFEIVEKDSYDEEDLVVYTDDEYEFVVAPVKRHTAPAAAAYAPPVATAAGGGNQALPPPAPETIIRCDDKVHHTEKTIAVQPAPPQGAVASPRSSPPPSLQKPPSKVEEKTVAVQPPPSPQKPPAKVEGKTIAVQPALPQGSVVASPRSSPQKPPAKVEQKTASPFNFYDLSVAAAPPGLLLDMSAAAPPLWSPAAYGMYGEVVEDDEVTDEEDYGDDYSYLYASCYDYADFGRSRRVKYSSGRRGRTKKASTKGRPRGEERSSHIAGNH